MHIEYNRMNIKKKRVWSERKNTHLFIRNFTVSKKHCVWKITFKRS